MDVVKEESSAPQFLCCSLAGLSISELPRVFDYDQNHRWR